ncbi:MAG: alpha/beta hydrolase [Pseudomonadota bacterium]
MPDAENSPATSEPAKPAKPAEPSAPPSSVAQFFPGFRHVDLAIDDVTIHAVIGGSGPPLLVLHGAPESHVMWHGVAAELAAHFTVVAADLRGYGRSSKPPEGDYSKRRMARDQVELMAQLGFERFSLLSHDRGSHIGRRMAKDYPGTLEKLVIMDVVPSTYIFENVTRKVAERFWMWFLWSQPAPLPENVMGPQAEGFTRMVAFGNAEVADDYALTNGNAAAFHAMCEDYRAGAGIDITHDHADRDVKITTPALVLWGSQSNVAGFDYPAIWKSEIEDVAFAELDCGHFLIVEKPKEVMEQVLPFLLGKS